jgi:SP family general alpha glucoside:H+ symporter-like MFS transporter
MAEPKASDAITPVDGPPAYGYSAATGPASDSSMTKVIQNAKAATEKEQSMSLMQGIRLYPKAVLWSVLISTCIAMEGYDISLVNNFYAFPQFNRKYGELLADGSYEVSAAVSSTNSGGGHPSISWSGVGLPLCGMKKLTIV